MRHNAIPCIPDGFPPGSLSPARSQSLVYSEPSVQGCHPACHHIAFRNQEDSFPRPSPPVGWAMADISSAVAAAHLASAHPRSCRARGRRLLGNVAFSRSTTPFPGFSSTKRRRLRCFFVLTCEVVAVAAELESKEAVLCSAVRLEALRLRSARFLRFRGAAVAFVMLSRLLSKCRLARREGGI